MRRFLSVGAAVAVLLGPVLLSPVAGGATTLHSGLYGKVTRGPITPVCVAEQPCSEPAAGATLRFLRDGHLVAQAHVKDDGTYRIALEPGAYTVAAQSRRPLDPSTTRVRTGRFVRVDFAIDTGIR